MRANKKALQHDLLLLQVARRIHLAAQPDEAIVPQRPYLVRVVVLLLLLTAVLVVWAMGGRT